MHDAHGMLDILNGLARNQALVGEGFESFKDEVASALNRILDDNIIMKQDLFILRQKVVEKEAQSSSSTSSSKTPSKPSVPQPGKTTDPKPSTSIPGSQKKKSGRRKALLIGDSISGNVEGDFIENILEADIKKVKAYSSVSDDVARFPAKNFTDVTQAELEKEKIDILLLQSGSVDITNLETKSNPEKNLAYFQQQTVISAKNIFSVAENAVKNHTNLEKVVLMNLTPRYDETSVDPLALKPVLATLFNNTLTEQWVDSKFKETSWG